MLSNSSSLDLKVLVCQIDPKYKDIESNMKRISISLERYTQKDKIDLILFPEMALTGYIFKSSEDILPYCEEAGVGVTFKFLKKIALQTGAYVLCGYPEVSYSFMGSPILYNSAMLVDRKGDLLLNYRKHFLYENDKCWSKAGDNFQVIELVSCSGKKFLAGIGICMDLNPYEFKDFEAFEWANFLLSKNVDAVFFLSNWIDSEPTKDDGKSIQSLVNYWLTRLTPMFDSKKNWAFYCANRVGKEENTVFAGCSCALKRQGEKVDLISVLNKRKESYLVAEISLPQKQFNFQ